MSVFAAERGAVGPHERERILAAFVELVAERGYHAVNTAAVAARAGVGEAGFKRHFITADECFFAAWDWLEGRYMSRLALAYSGLEDWRQGFRAAATETIRLIEDNPKQARFLVVEALSAGEQGRRRQQALAVRLADLLDRARAPLEEPAAPPAATAAWVIGIFFDRAYRCLSTGHQAELASQLPQLMFLAVSSYLGADAGLAELRTSH
jgi:AcrR family transcriptional regulator